MPLQVEAIISHKRLGKGNYNYDYRFQWKDPTKGDKWVPRRIALIYYPNLLRDYDAKRKKADEVRSSTMTRTAVFVVMHFQLTLLL